MRRFTHIRAADDVDGTVTKTRTRQMQCGSAPEAKIGCFLVLIEAFFASSSSESTATAIAEGTVALKGDDGFVEL